MKIIIATHDISDEAIAKPLAEAFRKMGHNAEVVYTEYLLFWRRISYKVPEKFTQTFLILFLANRILSIVRNRLQFRILKKVKDKKPDIFIAIKGKHIALDTIDKIKALGIQTVNWFPDGMWNIGTLRKFVPYYDAFFVMDPNCKKVLETEKFKNVYYLPMAAFKSDSSSIDDILKHKEYDLSFVGILASHKEREDILGLLKVFDLNIWGTSEWAESSLKNFYKGRARGRQMLDIYRKSKIVINIHVNNDATQGPNLRSFEAMISGAMVISDYKEGLAQIFTDKEDIVFFKNINELRSIVKYYIDNDQEREKIARNGYKKVINKHTMTNRSRAILNVLKG